ncbi:NUDIX hydrolase [Vallitalea longa]|uniref:8-oxo-dGTP diphosphatase n=1 Tax=Vallitalea longa TaxID=2936439 RepID=A0A9W5Y918_9FIRM|nr:NUDIX domain-containing protein [Vallitalea longa]GKX29482.1 NUDIX hydrolase [Vallitalea longa]
MKFVEKSWKVDEIMELWDLYDENRAKLNKTHVIGIPISEGEYHIVVDIWTINSKGEILITQRHQEKTFGLLWECTGGSVICGESSKVGALRELSEEVGINASNEQLLLIHTIRLKDRFVDTYITRQDVVLDDLELQAEEVVDAKFISFEELNIMWKNGLIVPRHRYELYQDDIINYIKKNIDSKL